MVVFLVIGCGELESACADKTACIPQESECDGTSDCADGSDELDSLCKLSKQLSMFSIGMSKCQKLLMCITFFIIVLLL